MNRRSFLSRVLGAENPALEKALNPTALNVSAGLEEYTQPLDAARARHLLRRIGFQCTVDEINAVTGLTPQQLIPALLFEGKPESEIVSLPPPSWALETGKLQPTQAEAQIDRQRMNELVFTWFAVFSSLKTSGAYALREKMTFFWHGLLTSDRQKVRLPQFMYWQQDKFRRNPVDGTKADDPAKASERKTFGNIKQLVRSMVSDPAMLVYLDGNQNQKNRPNENFGRELLELFTLGIGNYTEADVVAATKATTGWLVAFSRQAGTINIHSQFNPQFFDAGQKTFLGKTGAWNSDDLINIIFESDACARYFATKLYKAFVYAIPDDAIVEELAAELRKSGYELRPVLLKLFTSAHFYDEQFFGAQIKSPLELMAGLVRQLGITPPAVQAEATAFYNYAIGAMEQLNLELLYPPTVQGWKGHHDWITTTSFPVRQRLGEYLCDGKNLQQRPIRGASINMTALAKKFPAPDDAEKLVDDFAAYLLPVGISKKTKNILLGELLQGAPAYSWDIDAQNAEGRLRLLVKAIVKLPEFQLT